MIMETGKLAIDQSLFMMAFGRDVDYHDLAPQLIYLDRHTGDVMWLYESDEDAFLEVGLSAAENRGQRERIAAEPNRYLENPGLDHDDHHQILKRFLRSDWTDDANRSSKAFEAYSGSIGGWKKSVNDEGAIHAFYEYQETRITELAEEFLAENGIVPNWK
jgi:hypothetical protein